MDSILSVQLKDFSGDGKEFTKVSQALCRQFLGIWRKPVRNLHGIMVPRRSETNGLAERAVRRIKEGTTLRLLQSGLAKRSRTYRTGKHLINDDLQNHSKDQ